MKTIYKKIFPIAFLMILVSGLPALAQSPAPSNQDTLLMIVLGLVLLVAILVLIVALYMVSVLKTVLQKEQILKAEAQGVKYVEEEKESLWSKINKKLSDAVPVEEEESIMLDHDYDGIKELDNHLPPWWTALFYITIIIGVIYLFNYHIIHIFPLQEEEYANELKKAKELQASLAKTGAVETIDLSNPQPDMSSGAIENGKSVFQTNCISCHAPDGGGGVGPNLTDNYWLHGGDFKSIITTIHEGVSGTSMIPWKNVLSPGQIRDVASYVTTLLGTTPANPKEPQGEFVEASTTKVEESSADSVKVDGVETNADTIQVE